MSLSQFIQKYFRLEYILLFLFSFELFNKHHFVLFTLFLFLYVKNKINKKYLNKQFAIVVIWSLIYWLFASSHLWSSVQMPSLWCAFIIGYSLANDEEDVFKVIFVMAVGYAVEGLLTVYLGGGFQYAVDESSRFIKSIWGENTRAISALNVSMYIFSGCIVYILSNKEISVVYKILAIIFELGFVYITIMIAMRSSLIFNPLIVGISFLSLNGFKIKGRYFVVLLGIVAILIVLYLSDALGIKTFYQNSYLFTRFTEQSDGGVVNNSRYGLQGRFFDVYQIDYWGGLYDKIHFYFHNIWLDMYSFSGIVSAIFFLVLTVSFIKVFIVVYIRTDRREKSLLSGCFAAFMLPFYMDPMFWAAPCYFAMFIMFFGILVRRMHSVQLNP